MIRPSQLPIAERCGLAPALAAQRIEAPGRAAAKGLAYHARVARDPRAPDLLDALMRDELAEVIGWAVPELPERAEHEVPVGLTATGRYAPLGTPGNITEGTTDLHWLEGSTAIVGDLKTGVVLPEDGPYSLQLAAYGFALSDRAGAHSMRLGIWSARAGRWDWTVDIYLDSDEAADLWRRVQIAATKPPVAEPGPHCESCWERPRCPARLLPALAGPTAPELLPFIAGGGELTPEAAAAGLRVIGAMREVADRAEEHLRAAVRAGLVVEEDGKVYAPSHCEGRRYADAKALEADGLTQYLRQGRPYERWGWRRT